MSALGLSIVAVILGIAALAFWANDRLAPALDDDAIADVEHALGGDVPPDPTWQLTRTERIRAHFGHCRDNRDDDVTAVADAVREPHPHADPVAHAAKGCLYCITARDIVRSIADPAAWDKAFAEQLGGYR